MADPYKTARRTRKKYKTARKTALEKGDVTGANLAAKQMRKHGNVMRGLKGKKVKGKIPTRTTPETKKKVVPAVNIWETAKTHGDVWSQRWKTGGLQKTFGTESRYGLATRPDRWTEMTRSSAGQIEPPQVRSNRPWRPIEYSTGPWQKDNGWGGPERGRRGAVRPRWFKDPRTGEWRRG